MKTNLDDKALCFPKDFDSQGAAEFLPQGCLLRQRELLREAARIGNPDLLYKYKKGYKDQKKTKKNASKNISKFKIKPSAALMEPSAC